MELKSPDDVRQATEQRGWIPNPWWLLVCAVVLLGVAIACTVYLHPTVRLIREVNALGGEASSNYAGPELLSALIDKDRLTMFHRVVAIELQRTSVSDEWLTCLNGRGDVFDLVLYDTRITDAGIANLRDLPNLAFLDLDRSQIGNDALKGLTRFPDLNGLLLGETQVTDAGLTDLRTLTKLVNLNLQGTAVTDVGLAQLEGLTHLKWLFLNKTLVTDAGMVHLRRMENLILLELHSTAVTDAGLQQLRHLTSLEKLRIDTTKVTADGLADLQAALPYLVITTKPRTSIRPWPDEP
jgi:hypothetical protein